jgi:predicted nucleic-acid-binding Zn-ribbon protein
MEVVGKIKVVKCRKCNWSEKYKKRDVVVVATDGAHIHKVLWLNLHKIKCDFT